MATIEISEQVLARLRKVAEQENRAVEDVIVEALDQYAPELELNPEEASGEERINAFMMLAQVADELDIRSGRGDLSRRSRELLDTDCPDYLKQRSRKQGGDKGE